MHGLKRLQLMQEDAGMAAAAGLIWCVILHRNVCTTCLDVDAGSYLADGE